MKVLARDRKGGGRQERMVYGRGRRPSNLAPTEPSQLLWGADVLGCYNLLRRSQPGHRLWREDGDLRSAHPGCGPAAPVLRGPHCGYRRAGVHASLAAGRSAAPAAAGRRPLPPVAACGGGSGRERGGCSGHQGPRFRGEDLHARRWAASPLCRGKGRCVLLACVERTCPAGALAAAGAADGQHD